LCSAFVVHYGKSEMLYVTLPHCVPRMRHTRRLVVVEAYLEYASTIRCSPSIEQIVLSSGNKPLSCVSKLEREHARVVEVQLVLLRAIDVENLNITALHSVFVGVCVQTCCVKCAPVQCC